MATVRKGFWYHMWCAKESVQLALLPHNASKVGPIVAGYGLLVLDALKLVMRFKPTPGTVVHMERGDVFHTHHKG